MLSLIDGFNDDYVPLYAKGTLLEPLTSLFDEKHKETSFSETAKVCEDVYATMSLSPEQACLVEEKTREQSKSKLWFQQRAGRVTASKLRSVLHTNFSQPSVS